MGSGGSGWYRLTQGRGWPQAHPQHTDPSTATWANPTLRSAMRPQGLEAAQGSGQWGDTGEAGEGGLWGWGTSTPGPAGTPFCSAFNSSTVGLGAGAQQTTADSGTPFLGLWADAPEAVFPAAPESWG